ncbi:alpha/beta hydrolase fold domain-containing protein [Dactylosporangium sp. NPDC005572]|uniref:alpha/beta hydrolase fold domain-containing protein n=1 Tax=Dactylosporangium sp. NPDC005572 TaxID=3156889 RepID=UPI0033BE1A7E
MTILSQTIAALSTNSARSGTSARAPTVTNHPSTTPAPLRPLTGPASAADIGASLDVRDLSIPGGPHGRIRLRLFRLTGAAGALPVIVYVHGDDHVVGNVGTRRRATMLATDLTAAVVVVDYSRCPKTYYAAAVEETYAAVAWLARHGNRYDLDGTRIAAAADPTTAGMAADLMLLSDLCGGPSLAAHVPLDSRAKAILRAALAA